MLHTEHSLPVSDSDPHWGHIKNLAQSIIHFSDSSQKKNSYMDLFKLSVHLMRAVYDVRPSGVTMENLRPHCMDLLNALLEGKDGGSNGADEKRPNSLSSQSWHDLSNPSASSTAMSLTNNSTMFPHNILPPLTPPVNPQTPAQFVQSLMQQQVSPYHHPIPGTQHLHQQQQIQFQYSVPPSLVNQFPSPTIVQQQQSFASRVKSLLPENAFDAAIKTELAGCTLTQAESNNDYAKLYKSAAVSSTRRVIENPLDPRADNSNFGHASNMYTSQILNGGSPQAESMTNSEQFGIGLSTMARTLPNDSFLSMLSNPDTDLLGLLNFPRYSTQPGGQGSQQDESQGSRDQVVSLVGASNDKNETVLGKRSRQTVSRESLNCQICHEVDTPEWRKGPEGSHTLCNACGLNYAKKIKQERKTLEELGHTPDSIERILEERKFSLIQTIANERAKKSGQRSSGGTRSSKQPSAKRAKTDSSTGNSPSD